MSKTGMGVGVWVVLVGSRCREIAWLIRCVRGVVVSGSGEGWVIGG